MKKLLSILLLCFCFSATAQNSSTIQQLLDEGVTIGELLDAGVLVDEFYGMEYEDGTIFDIDTLNGTGKVALILDKSLAFQCYEGDVNTYNPISISENDGMQNTISIASSCPENITGSSYALNYVSNDGMNDWYIPTRNEFESMHQNLILNHFWADISHSFMISEIVNATRYWTGRFQYTSNSEEDCCYWNDETRTSASRLLLVREFDLNQISPSYITLSLNDNQDIQQIIETGATPDEFYGMEYEDGTIFDIDTLNGTGKVALILDKSLAFQCYEGDVNTYNPISISENDGMQNTISIASSCPENITGSSYALNYVSNDGMNDWYIPTRNEFESMHQNLILNHFWADISHSFMISEIVNATRYWTGRFQYTSNSEEDCCYWNDETRTSASRLLLVREFDLSAPTIIEVSPALQSFLETYTPPVMEEEIVSDANSFDVLNPLSYNGEFEAVHHHFNSEGSYTVPQGKSLIIKQLNTINGNYPYFHINNILVTKLGSYNTQQTNSLSDLILSSEDVISVEDMAWSTGNSYSVLTFHGVLINKNIQTVHYSFSEGSYTVPQGKSLIIKQLYADGGGYPFIYINDVYVSRAQSIGTNETNSLSDLILSSEDVISIEDVSNTPLTFHGILIDNSNYTYATDYELIDALNEGMDSLSTMSEVVVQENDSLTTENAILLEDNEALMAIDYNYDSLQYVTEYLYSQVFDLQQELLVPNIDVDMAIGWNMIGFSCPEDKSAEDALLSIVDEIIIFKDNNGSVYMPEFGFNGIGNLTPGYGYQLKVTDYILDFNICE
jgi:hypothetical protein